MTKGEHDEVHHPSHYTFGMIEVIDAIEDWELDYHRGNCVKYLVRAGRKTGSDELTDLQKAKWYLERRIKLVEENRYAARIRNTPQELGGAR